MPGAVCDNPAMSRLRVIAVSCGLVLTTASAASAQDERRVGLVMGFPASVGVVWHVSDRLALRADGTYNWSSATIEGVDDSLTTSPSPIPVFEIAITQESSTQSGSIGLSLLFDLHRQEQFRIYLAPRVGWAVAHTESTVTIDVSRVQIIPGVPPRGNTIGESETAYSPTFGASIGASTRVGDRFGVFGEAGFSYNQTTTEEILRATRRSFGIRAGVGAMLFF
jgi:hypothetical protein